GFGEVLTQAAETDFTSHFQKGLGKILHIRLGRTKDEVGQTGGGLLADARKSRELLDETVEGGRHQNIPGIFTPREPMSPLISFSISSLARIEASLTAATIKSWSIPTSSGVTTSFSILRPTRSPFPFTVAVTIPPPLVASKVFLASSSCCFSICFWSSWACFIIF